MSAIDDFVAFLETTEVMKQVLNSLRQEPAHLLGDICREYARTGQPVPDHRLEFFGYLGEVTPKILISAGLVIRLTGDRLSIYTYQPTPEGLEQYQKLKADGFYKSKS